MNKKGRGFGCFFILISALVGIAVAFSKFNNERTKNGLKQTLIKFKDNLN